MGAVQRRVRHRIFWTTDRHTVVRMLNSPGNNGHSLGLSVGATNLAGTRDGQTAVIRPAELTLRGQRLTGFVDRVGDPVPLIAPDGSKYRSEELLADALGSMARAVTDGVPVSDVAVTVPAHWRASVVDILRRNLRGRLPVVSDATAALTALRANPACRRAASSCCATSVAAAPASRWPMRRGTFRRSARPCAFPTSLVTRSIRRS